MVRRNWQQEDYVDSSALNDLYRDSLPAYETEQARMEDWFQPITDLRRQQDQAPPEIGQNTVIQPGDDPASFDVWTGQDWKPWRRVAPSETGLIQVVITDVAVEENAVGSVFARFQVYLVNAEATLENFTDPRYRIDPLDLGTRKVMINYKAADYDPLTAAEKARQGITAGNNPFREAIGGIDYDDTVIGTLVWTREDESVVKEIDVAVYANPEDELLERFQLELSAFHNVKPLKPIGICAITDNVLPLLRVNDVTVKTDRISAENPNIAARNVPMIIRLNQVAEVDINFTYTTYDITARGTGVSRDYVPTAGAGVIRAGQTTPETVIQINIPTQLLEATETFGFRIISADDPNRAIFLKPEATITIEGRALKPTYYPQVAEYGPGFGGSPARTLYQVVRCVPAPDFRSGPLVIDWSTDDTSHLQSPGIWARPGYHYLSASGRITFNAGESTKTIAIANRNWGWTYSTNPESPEYQRAEVVDLRINYTLVSGDGEPASSVGIIQMAFVRDTTLTGDNFITLPDTISVQEGERAVIPVTLTAPPPTGITASLAYATTAVSGQSIEGTHYTRNTGTLRWAPWTGTGAYNNVRYVYVQTLQTATGPATRTLDVVFSSPSNLVLPGSVSSIKTRIVINTQLGADVVLTASNISIPEPPPGVNLTITMPVRLSGNTLAGTHYAFDYATQDVSAGPNILYTPVTRTRQAFAPITRSGDSTQVQIPFTILGGRNITRPAFFDVYFGRNVSGGNTVPTTIQLAQPTYRVTITPRQGTGPEGPVLPRVNVSNRTVDETAGTISVPVTLTSPAPDNCSFIYQTVDGTARSGTDYVTASGTLNVASGARTAIIRVAVIPDTASTEDKTFQIRLSGYRNCLPGNRSTITITIRNVDAVRPDPQPEQAPAISISDTSLENPDSGTDTGSFTISTSRPLPEAITGTIRTSDGTARAGTHYNPLSNVAWTIRPGTTFIEVPVTIRAQTLGSNVSFRATISLTTNNASLDDRQATFTITQQPEPTSIRVNDLNLSDAATTRASVLITRTGNLQRITFRVSTVDVTARSGIRYRSISNRLITMVQGARAITVPVDIIRPTGRVPQARFILRATSISAGSITKMDGVIVLPEYEPVIRTLPYITMASGFQTEPVSGHTAHMVFTIMASKVWSEPISGSFRTSNITATAGTDYTTTITTWTIPVGQRSTQVRVPILADTTNELSETFRAQIGIDSGNARFRTGQAALSVTGTIRNRTQATNTISLPRTITLRRGFSSNVPITRTGSLQQSTTVRMSTYSTGSASPTADFPVFNNFPRLIPTNSARNDNPISIPFPSQAQPEETFGMRLSSPTGSAMIGTGVCNITLPATPATQAFIVPPLLSVDFRETQILNKATIYSSTFVYMPVTPNRPVTITWSGRIWGRPPQGNFQTFDVRRTGTLTLQPGQRVGLIQWSTEKNTGFGLTARIIGSILVALLTFGAAGGLSIVNWVNVFQGLGYTLGQSIYLVLGQGLLYGGAGASTVFVTGLTTSLISASSALLGGSAAAGSSIIPGDLTDEDRGRLMSALIRSDLNTSIQITGITGATLQPPNTYTTSI